MAAEDVDDGGLFAGEMRGKGAPGHDGTMIPLSIVHKKGMTLNGENSRILDGYGAYAIMEFTPNGPVNTPEFGTVKDEVECRALYEMDGEGRLPRRPQSTLPTLSPS